MKKFFDKNSVWFGILVGAIVPVVMYFIIKELVYYITLWTNPVLIQAYHQTYITNATSFLIAIIFNIIFFRKYMKEQKYELTGRGVLVITMIYTFVFVIMKLNVLTNFFD